MKSYIEILKLVIKCMEADGKDSFFSLQTELIDKFEQLRASGLQNGFMDFIKQEYAADEDIYEELLRYIANLTNEEIMKYELLKFLLQKELQAEKDYFSVLELKKQLMYYGFVLGKREKIEEDFVLYTYLQSETRKKIQRQYEMIPVNERNQDFIIISATQLLGTGHSPSRLILDIAKILETQLKKHILFVVTVKNLDEKTKMKIDVPVTEVNYMRNVKGRFQYDYFGHVFQGYQLLMERGNESEWTDLMDSIYQLQPLCVWHFGEIPAFSSVMQQFTSFLYMGFVQGYPGIPADIILNYFPKSATENKEERKFLIDHGIKVKDFKYASQRRKTEHIYQRKEFEIPEYAFCIAVVGNRLESECKEEFISVLNRVMETEKDICIIYIGKMEDSFKDRIRKWMPYNDRILFLGYQKNLQEVLALTDLFVNPPRIGGGTGAVMSMIEGKPVVTLGGCDVASFVGDLPVCSKLEEFGELILKYKNDTRFYLEQSEKASGQMQRNKMSEEDIAKELQEILDLIINE